ncbi:MAG: DUF4830 domain-containing protein, partial [Oscillospiraceae bacterium]|nr:DUF4830 domain-containing protein [Oscillospiraceae bacterium]
AEAETASPNSTSVATDIDTNEARIAYLESYGWQVKTEPTKTQEVRIPTDPSDIFERYNDLQIAQGFDLHEFAGKTVRRYVYEITNYPNSTDTHYATILIYKGTVIGGDVCAASKNGTMHGLEMPKSLSTKSV